ncbi:flagellar hook-basal body complex protein FliE [Bacillus sp. JCM 19045]|nr:flagellar hook-basal body complex protein FliE [Bacillus sp. JCM 19045]
MELVPFQGLVQLNQTSMVPKNSGVEQTAHSFQSALKTALTNVNDAQLASGAATQAMAQKKPIDLHEVMITANKASVSLQATLEIRNKAVEAYQEMMRMQV